MKNKKQLGEKSIKFVILEFIVILISLMSVIICLVLYINYEVIESILLALLSFILFIITSYLAINTIIKPKYIIEYDDSGVYLNYTKKKSTYILFKDIENIIETIPFSKYLKYSFGSISIITKNKKYKIGIIKDIKVVKKYLYSRIAYKYHRVK